MNTLSYFKIQATDVPKAVAFYKAVFGWNFVKEENFPIEYYRIETENMFGGILKRPMQTPPMEYGTNAFTCSFIVENFDAMAAIITQNGSTVAMPKLPYPAVAGRVIL
ncbi:VOC family protein [Flavobacterium rhizosphaerae]|uniref:VOC family protein n=1 Tax=Flavobacterium rhizosphaerae TaxID=3163298 RepID=A0ABW8Z029_9FLAO